MMLTIALATFVCSCGEVEDAPPTAYQDQSTVRSLGFTMRLADGSRSQLPPSVAAAISDTSSLNASYRETLSHDESHAPLWQSALDPTTYSGATLGARTVEASAELRIFNSRETVGDYTASANVSKTYSMYKDPSNAELEESARAAVRKKIDDQVVADAPRIIGAQRATSAK